MPEGPPEADGGVIPPTPPSGGNGSRHGNEWARRSLQPEGADGQVILWPKAKPIFQKMK